METDDFKIKKMTRGTKPFKKRLFRDLKKYTESKAGPLRVRELVLSVVGKRGKSAGGLVGVTYWNALFIDILWVDGKYRGFGLGRMLVERAEMEARQRGCALAHVNTHSLQAPGFYRKMGYKVFGRLRGLPKGQSDYHFYKKL
jgi:ribosomal protein S18 acetylase RimI-like enzyme